MIDTEARPTRRHRKRYCICSVCRKNLVSKKGGRCKWCGCKAREENYRTQGIKHQRNLTFTGIARSSSSNKRRNTDHNCAAHWMINEMNFGKCAKCDFESRALLCQDTGLPCPHQGVKDFAALQEKHARRFTFLESNRKGGEKSGKLRGGKRGRPRKIREVLK